MHVTRMEYDPKKAQENLRKHGISFGDAESALRDPFAITVEDEDARLERRFVTMGLDQGGELLVVVYAERDGEQRLISARRATRKERKTYEG